MSEQVVLFRWAPPPGQTAFIMHIRLPGHSLMLQQPIVLRPGDEIIVSRAHPPSAIDELLKEMGVKWTG